jgi:6-phosphogluconolactonase
VSVSVRSYDGLESLGRAAASEFAALCTRAIAERGSAYVALSGGSTPRLLYEQLTAESVEWDRVELFWSDERAVSPTSAESNYRLAKDVLLARVAPRSVHRMRGEALDLPAEAERYEREIRARVPELAFDLVLLGLGSDGHTASLFPNTSALEQSARLVVANRVPERGERLTFTLPLLALARQLLFVVAGSDKASIVARVLGGAGRELPAQRARAKQVLWLLDVAAARELRDPSSN